MNRLALLAMMTVLASSGMVNAALAHDQRTSCPTIDDARRALAFPISKDAAMRFQPGDPARRVLAEAKAMLKQCPTSEGAWYGILRARELLGCDPRRTLDMADEARRLVPESVRIATLRARLVGTGAAAKEALALDPAYMPAQLALASALLDEGRSGKASAILRRMSYPEARGLMARVFLGRREYRKAISEFGQGGAYVLGGDIFLLEPNAGLRWPWNDDQVLALAQAELGHPEVGARILSGDHVGTLPELRDAVSRRTQSAQRLMTAIGRLIGELKDAPEARTELTVALARLRFVAGQVDEALALIGGSASVRARFCSTLSELIWVLSAGGTRPVPQSDKLASVCSSGSSGMRLPTEPPECMSHR